MGLRIIRFTILFAVLAILTSSEAFSQITKYSETVVIDGQNYILHVVDKGQTQYSIAKAYDVEQSTLLSENPSLKDGLKAGDVLKIPQKKDKQKKTKKSRKKRREEEIQPTETHYFHRVQRKETVYSIAKQYKVDPEDIYRENPGARKKIKRGQILKIPREKPETRPEEKAADKPRPVIKPEKESEVTKETEYTSPDSYFSYRVMSGDTYFGLKRRYGIEQSELERINPQLHEGLKAGMEINIPRKQYSATQIVPVDKDKFIYHEVEKGETLYGLSRLYDIKISTIKELNPVLKVRHPVVGEKLLILKKEDETITEEDISEPGSVPEKVREENIYQVASDPGVVPPGCVISSADIYEHRLNVALFLPLYLEANDTVNIIRLTEKDMLQEINKQRRMGIANPTVDTIKIRDPKIIYRSSENYLRFYEGVLIALQELKNKGLDVELHVFDTNRDPEVVKQQVLSSNFLSFDLIIGPVYGNCQEFVSYLSAKNRIPMVSPLSPESSLTTQNPYYFQVRPDKKYILDATSDFIGEDFFNKNVIVMKMGNIKHLDESGVVEKVREKLFSNGFYGDADNVLFQEFNFDEDGYYGLERLMDPSRENVVIVPVNNAADISRAITNLNTASKKFNVTYLAINYQSSNYESIETEYLHNLNMQYLDPYYVDYNKSSVIRFIENYRQEFNSEPNKFSFQGYDIAWYFLNAMGKLGKDFIDCLPYFKVDLLQSDYNFQKVSDFGGYMNHTLFIMEYTRNYEVQTTGKVGDETVIISTKERSPDNFRIWNGIDPRKRKGR